jgi:hypothetical protein
MAAMVSIHKVLLDFLRRNQAIADLADGRLYAGPALPKGYAPSLSGPAILFSRRGGNVDYTGLVLNPSVQFRCYAASSAKAGELDRALYDALHDKHGPGIKRARAEVLGQPLIEPETDPPWHYVLSFYRVRITNPPDAA